MTPEAELMESIKLVIWDLDETFWKGTLSEEGAELIDEHVHIIKELTDRGIMNSIVSKNDFEQARNRLEDAGIWDYFIFPSIEWSPKGPLVKKTIEDCQLRAPNVLFLDDNHMNLEEAKFYCPELHTEGPDFIPQILPHPAFKGKDDKKHSRLKQYKILEKKADEKKDYSSNEEFLRSSAIKVHFITDLNPHKERLLELLNRTNQLNYTKKRLNEEEVQQLITDNTKKALIEVSDKFGNYGIVGFYALHEAEKRLEHFCFSCRILNLGVVQYVYHKLNRPEITIVPNVAEEPDEMNPDWIEERATDAGIDNIEDEKFNDQRHTIFFKGSCDLGVPVKYLQNRISVNFITEFNFRNSNNETIISDHTFYVKESMILSETEKKDLIENIPFIESKTYSKAIFQKKYKLIVFSVLSDYFQNVYKAKNANIHLPHGYNFKDLTNPDHAEDILLSASKMDKTGYTNDFLNYFRKNYTSEGRVTPKEFVQNLHFIRNHIQKDVPILFLNGAEVEPKKPNVQGTKKRFAEMNSALEEFIKSSENCHLLDIRKIVYKQEHLTKDTVTVHYTRERYFELGEALFQKVESLLGTKAIESAPLRVQVQILLLRIKTFILNNNMLPKPVHNSWRRIRGKSPLT
jgi:FkbH-like protein